MFQTKKRSVTIFSLHGYKEAEKFLDLGAITKNGEKIGDYRKALKKA